MPIRCSIIVPSYNTRALTLRCLEALHRLSSDACEIILVDNQSTDDTVEQVARHFPSVLRLQQATNSGFARACNRGAQAATGSTLLFLNSDTEVTPGSIDVLLAWLDSHPGTAVAGPQLIGPAGEILQMSWGWVPLFFQEIALQFLSPRNLLRSVFRQELVKRLHERTRSVSWVSGACLAIRREIFESLDGFDEAFELYFEDVDLCCRAGRAGWRIDYVPAARVVHHLGQSVRSLSPLATLIYQQSHIAFYRRYGNAAQVFVLKAYLLTKWLLTNSSPTDARSMSAREYLESYLAVILEKRKIRLRSVA